MTSSSKYVLAVDIGTSTIRSCLYDADAELKRVAQRQVELIYGGEEGAYRVEIDPEILWQSFCDVVRESIDGIVLSEIVTIGICSQRNSFITWNKDTGQPCHRFVTWKDCRATDACQQWNRSWLIKLINCFGSIAFWLTRQKRYLCAKVYSFINAMVTHRLMVTIEQSEEMQQLLKNDNLVYGCIDTWILYKLTAGKVVATEPSSASSTGTFDPYIMDWGYSLLNRISFPTKILPPILQTACDRKPLGLVDSSIFGAQIPIGSLSADQQAAVFGCGCWDLGQVKVSLGTGGFLDINTGSRPHASISGIYPLVGWQINKKTVFCAEASTNDIATTLNWASSIGLFRSVHNTSDIALSVHSSHGVYFVPAFGGLQAPLNDDGACCAFMGLRPDTNRAHMVRAILESIAFRVYQIWNCLCQEIDFPIVGAIRCCGGVSENDFLCQTIADLIDRPLERMANPSCSSALGAAFLAGISIGLWKEDDLRNYVQTSRVFEPIGGDQRQRLLDSFSRWAQAVQRCLGFYPHL